MREVLAILVLLVCISCQIDKESKTYFGGGIINPLSSHILLCQKGKVIDTIPIDQDGHFSYRFNLKTSGLFSFKHGYEFQVFYAEPKDSITLRLNTKEFDESLVYGGSNAHENNFLIENFLLNQENNALIYSYYKIPPLEFERKIDSIREERMERLNHLKKNNKVSKTYLDIAEQSIDFEYYDMKERYVFLVKKFFPEKVNQLSSTFFDYRKNVDFNNDQILELIEYQHFLDNFLKNKSIDICLKNQSKDCYNTASISNLDSRISLIDSLLEHDFIRKHYFSRFFQEEVIFSQTATQLQHSTNHLKTFNLTDGEKAKLESLVEFQKSMLVNQNLGDVEVKNRNFETLKLKDIISNKHCIIYSWSVNSKGHMKQRMNKISAIKQAHPNIQLIGINIDFDKPEEWKNALKNYGFNIENEYQIIPEEHYMFYRNYLNKILFLDRHGNIKMSETILTDNDFDYHLKNFISI